MIKGKSKGHTPSDPAEARRRPTSLSEGGFKGTQKVNAVALNYPQITIYTASAL